MTDPIITPVRVKLQRTKGWKMPPNTIKVDRTTMWGNRWKIGTWSNTLGRHIATMEEAVDLYRLLAWPQEMHRAWIRENLRGKNLACWCRLDACCHADVLLEIANAPR